MLTVEGIVEYSPCVGDCSRCPVKHRAVIYGPVASRRRGRSLGVNLYPLEKVCTFNCIYCLRGETKLVTFRPTHLAVQVGIERVVKILEKVLERLRGNVDTIDISGNGEPTLYPHLPELCAKIRELCERYNVKSLGIFTNGVGLQDRHIYTVLKYVDHVEFKLDTCDKVKFQVINDPHPHVKLEHIIDTLSRTCREGVEVAVQIMLIRIVVGDYVLTNYTREDACKLVEVLTRAEPNVVHIYTAYRTSGRYANVRPVTCSEAIEFIEVLREHGLQVKVLLPDSM